MEEEDEEDEEEEPPLYLPRLCFIILFISVISAAQGEGKGRGGVEGEVGGVEGEGEMP